jgi:hypothetical protein
MFGNSNFALLIAVLVVAVLVPTVSSDKCDNMLSGFACCCSGTVTGTTKATSESTCQAVAGNVWMTCLPGYAYSYPVSSSHYAYCIESFLQFKILYN